MWEETGLSVVVGEVLFVRQFGESARGIYHVEQVSLKNLAALVALEGEIRSISQACWTKQELAKVEVYPPQLKLKHVLWQKLDSNDLAIVHLGYS